MSKVIKVAVKTREEKTDRERYKRVLEILAKHEIGVEGFGTDGDGRNVLFTVPFSNYEPHAKECFERLKESGITNGQNFFFYQEVPENPFFSSLEFSLGHRKFKMGFVFPDGFHAP